MKKQIEAILKKHGFTDSEYEDVFAAMSEVLYLVGDNQQKHWKVQDMYKEIASSISDIDTFINEHS